MGLERHLQRTDLMIDHIALGVVKLGSPRVPFTFLFFGGSGFSCKETNPKKGAQIRIGLLGKQ